MLKALIAITCLAVIAVASTFFYDRHAAAVAKEKSDQAEARQIIDEELRKLALALGPAGCAAAIDPVIDSYRSAGAEKIPFIPTSTKDKIIVCEKFDLLGAYERTGLEQMGLIAPKR
jgi:hypothetical protein